MIQQESKFGRNLPSGEMPPVLSSSLKSGLVLVGSKFKVGLIYFDLV
jgi:hypothetical protein